ncbi:hypothetical protein X895_4658 [Burkholderia pseudomallei MSHR4503]|nr:hypothetical protein X895_4658 [Burkholderia pseudomallei MSHR4503]
MKKRLTAEQMLIIDGLKKFSRKKWFIAENRGALENDCVI